MNAMRHMFTKGLGAFRASAAWNWADWTRFKYMAAEADTRLNDAYKEIQSAPTKTFDEDAGTIRRTGIKATPSEIPPDIVLA